MPSCEAVLDVDVIEDPRAAVVALDPFRTRILAELREPASAASLAQRLGLARQKVNYHLRSLEASGLIRVAEERRHGGLTERLLVATAASYVVSPAALGATDPSHAGDRLSARYVVALGARLIREVGALVRGADGRVATLSIDTEIAFASADERTRFANDLTRTVTELAARYHTDGGRPHRLVVAAHPTPKEEAR